MGVRTRISQHETVRRRLGWGVRELAKATGFSHSYVSQVEGGLIPPSERYRTAAANALEVPEEVLFEQIGARRERS